MVALELAVLASLYNPDGDSTLVSIWVQIQSVVADYSAPVE